MVYHCAQAGRAQGREGGAANARVELHRVFLLVLHARESGFQLRLRLKVPALALLGLQLARRTVHERAHPILACLVYVY